MLHWRTGVISAALPGEATPMSSTVPRGNDNVSVLTAPILPSAAAAAAAGPTKSSSKATLSAGLSFSFFAAAALLVATLVALSAQGLWPSIKPAFAATPEPRSDDDDAIDPIAATIPDVAAERSLLLLLLLPPEKIYIEDGVAVKLPAPAAVPAEQFTVPATPMPPNPPLLPVRLTGGGSGAARDGSVSVSVSGGRGGGGGDEGDGAAILDPKRDDGGASDDKILGGDAGRAVAMAVWLLKGGGMGRS